MFHMMRVYPPQVSTTLCHYIRVGKCRDVCRLTSTPADLAQGVASPPGPPGASRAMSRQWAAHMSALEQPAFPPSARLGCHLDNFTSKIKPRLCFYIRNYSSPLITIYLLQQQSTNRPRIIKTCFIHTSKESLQAT